MSADEMTPGKVAYLAWAEELGVYDRWADFTEFYHRAWEVAAVANDAPPVWLDPQPVVPRPETGAPTLAEDVETVEWRLEGGSVARAALRRVIAAALAGEGK